MRMRRNSLCFSELGTHLIFLIQEATENVTWLFWLLRCKKLRFPVKTNNLPVLYLSDPDKKLRHISFQKVTRMPLSLDTARTILLILSPDSPHEEISRESNKWNFKYYGNEMLQRHGWQWAIFTSLSKLRIYSALIYAMSSYEFNLKKCEGTEFSRLVLQERTCLTWKLPRKNTDYSDGRGTMNPWGLLIEEWEHCFILPPIKCTLIEVVQQQLEWCSHILQEITFFLKYILLGTGKEYLFAT